MRSAAAAPRDQHEAAGGQDGTGKDQQAVAHLQAEVEREHTLRKQVMKSSLWCTAQIMLHKCALCCMLLTCHLLNYDTVTVKNRTMQECQSKMHSLVWCLV